MDRIFLMTMDSAYAMKDTGGTTTQVRALHSRAKFNAKLAWVRSDSGLIALLLFTSDGLSRVLRAP